MEFKLILDATPVLLALVGDFVSALRGLSVAAPAQTSPQTQVFSQTALPDVPAAAPTTSATSAPVVPPQPPSIPAFDTQAHVTPPQAPAAPATAAPAATPTIYTPEQVNAACAPLIDAGRVAELKAILKDQFGVNSLQVMTPEQLAEFVVVVRGLGAQI